MLGIFFQICSRLCGFGPLRCRFADVAGQGLRLGGFVLALVSALSAPQAHAQEVNCQDPANLGNDECIGLPPDPALGDPTNLIPLLAPVLGVAFAGALAGAGGSSTPSTTSQ